MLKKPHGSVAELVDALDSKSCGRKAVRVQVPPRPPLTIEQKYHKKIPLPGYFSSLITYPNQTPRHNARNMPYPRISVSSNLRIL